MHSKRCEHLLFIRIDRGEPLVASLTRALTEHGVAAGSISAIGAVEHAELLYYDIHTKTYSEKIIPGLCELVALTGNVSRKDSATWVHAHAVLGDANMQTVGGHLREAIVGVTCEVTVHIANDALDRTPDESIGLHLWNMETISEPRT